MDTSPHTSDFVNVNGIRLHYLDWGGDGPVLSVSNRTGQYAQHHNFAPRFTDRFHVLALTRRGHGESDFLKPVMTTCTDRRCPAVYGFSQH